MRLSELVGKHVITESGRKMGVLLDVVATGRPDHGQAETPARVESIICGRLSRFPGPRDETLVSWTDVLAFNGDTIVIRNPT